jgi:hypothetical protein
VTNATMQIGGVEPHKGSHTTVAIDAAGQPLGELRLGSRTSQVERLVS